MTTDNNSAVVFGSLNVTPGVALVKTPEAVEFIQHVGLTMQRNVMLGDPAKFNNDNDVFNAINRAHTSLEQGAATISALTRDETRSEPERHHVGAQVSERVVAELEATQHVLNVKADGYTKAAMAAVEAKFTPKTERLFMYDRIASWVERMAKDGANNGYGQITEAVKTNSDFAMVVMSFPHQLLGLPHTHLMGFRTTAVETWAPESAQGLMNANQLTDLSERIGKTIGRVKASFSSPMIAAKYKTRVAV